MGSYSVLLVDDHQIWSYKNEHLTPLGLTIFREADRFVKPATDDDGSETYRFVGYRVGADVARDRLAIMGFSDRTIRRRYQEGLDAEIAEKQRWLSEEAPDSEWGRSLQEETTHLTVLGYDDWLSTYIEALRCPVDQWQSRRQDWLWKRVADPFADESVFGLRNFDERMLAFAALRALPEARWVTFDITDSVVGGWIEPDEALADWAVRELAGDYPVTQSTLVLTEGPTDSEFLRESLSILLPHLAPYFSVFDFAAARTPGGVGPLLTMVKTLAGARIANRVVAVLDNDAAAEAAMSAQLKNVSLPARFRVLRHPRIELAAQYPAVGPDGIALTDVNGRAASIELYLGRDVLTGEDGILIPIQWKGYEESLRRYQGEILQKEAIHARFRSKVASAKVHRPPPTDSRWQEMRDLLHQIVHAFDDL